MPTSTDIEQRAAVHAALGDPVRLAIVDELAISDRAPLELRRVVGIESNLLAHHLDVLEAAGLVERTRSTGDRRRRYICLRRTALDAVVPGRTVRAGPALFVCSANSARSQLAAAVWRQVTGERADSAGTHPATRVHPGAVSAARRAGIDLPDAAPRALDDSDTRAPLVVTVCDRAHEEVGADRAWLHWSLPDPVPSGTAAAFDATVTELRDRVAAVLDPAGAAS